MKRRHLLLALYAGACIGALAASGYSRLATLLLVLVSGVLVYWYDKEATS